MPRFHGVVIGAAIGAALLWGHAALADSRIFTARASAPGVVIEEAFRNGKQLTVAGHGDGTTLFRIDEPSTIVACANRFDFVTSTGEKVNLAADMCVLNWDVTVNVAEAPETPTPPAPEAAAPTPSEPPPATTAESPKPNDLPPVPDVPEVPPAPAEATEPPPAASPGTSFSQIVTVSADDPAAIIASLTIDGAPAPITAREGRAVQFEIQGTEQGIVCERDLGLTLGDGRTLIRKVNLCLNDWHVVVALAGPDSTQPSPPPAVATPAPPPATEPTAGRAWSFNGGTLAATLVFGAPGTSDSAFLAGCTRGADVITITLSEATVPGALPGETVPVTFFAGGFTKSYQGKMSPVEEGGRPTRPEVFVAPGDPLWAAIIKEANLGITAGSAYSTSLSLKGSAAAARQFLAACQNQKPVPTSPPATAGGPGPAPGPAPAGGITARYRCEGGGNFTVTYYGNSQTAILSEPGAPQLELYWTDDGRRGRYVAGEARLTIRDEDVRWSRFGEQARTCLPR